MSKTLNIVNLGDRDISYLKVTITHDLCNLVITKSNYTKKFANEVDELRALPGHMLRAFRIQYLQNEHYALWEVIEFGDSYKAPLEETGKGPASESSAKKKGSTVVITTEDMQKRRIDVKARTTLLLALRNEHQWRFSKYETAKELWEAILNTFGGNEATKKTKKNQFKQQYGNFKAEGSETLEQTFNILQAIVSHLEFMDVEIEQDDLNQKFLTSLTPEWLISLKKLESNSQNMAFISPSNTSSRKGKVHTASVPTASIQVSTASTDVVAASLSHDTTGKKITIQGSDVAGFDKSKVECFNCHKMGHFAKECRAPRSQDRGKRESYKQGPMEEELAPKTLMAIDGIGWDWSYMANEEENHALVADDEVPTVEVRLVEFKEHEIKFCKKIRGLERDVEIRDKIEYLMNELEQVKKEKESLDIKLRGFEKASKDLDNLLGSQRSDKNKEGLGYNAVPPPPPAQVYSPPKKDLPWTCLPEFVDDTVTDYSRPTPSIDASKYYTNDLQSSNFLITEHGESSDEPASLSRDDIQGEAFPTVSSLDAGQDKENIAKTSALPYESSLRVTSLDTDEGNQDLEISRLKARVKSLEDKERRGAEPTQEDAPITRGIISMDAVNILSSGGAPASVSTTDVLPTVGVPTIIAIFTTANKGKEKVVESKVPKKRKLQEQLDAQFAREIEEEFAREYQRLSEQLARDSEIARLHAKEELKIMIEGEKLELISELVKYQDHRAKILKYQAQQSKPLSKKKQREFYMLVLKIHAGWKTIHFRGMTLKQIKEKFIPVWKQLEDFMPMSSKEEGERVKRQGLKIDQGSSKRVKAFEDVSEEELKGMMQLVPLKEVYVEALQVKQHIIDWEIHSEGKREYWKITRLGGHTTVYQFFVDMLKQFDREDLHQLWTLVKETFSFRQATKDREKELWVELKRLFEPNFEDQLWIHNQAFMHDPLDWKLYNTCGVHHVYTKDQEIFMLVDKDYPLRKGLATLMISNKLQVEQYSQMADDLILKIHNIANSPR
nr:hypothetical protein [Tanacetum cinerariifolium]